MLLGFYTGYNYYLKKTNRYGYGNYDFIIFCGDLFRQTIIRFPICRNNKNAIRLRKNAFQKL